MVLGEQQHEEAMEGLRSSLLERLEREIGATGGAAPPTDPEIARVAAACLATRDVAGAVLGAALAPLERAFVPRFCARLAACAADPSDAGFAGAFSAELARLRAAAEWLRALLVRAKAAIVGGGGAAAARRPADRLALLAAEPQLQRALASAVRAGAPEAALLPAVRRFYALALADAAADPRRLAPGAPAAEGVAGVAAGLRALGLAELGAAAAAAVVAAHVERDLHARASRIFDASVLDAALEEVPALPLALLRLALPPGPGAAAALARWAARLRESVYAGVGGLRVAEMFDIVVDFPDSLPALEDLRRCLAPARLHRRLVAAFGAAIRARLLHPGASTADVIQQYVSAIRALQRVDASGSVLDAVGAPIRDYLRARKDTIRCVVAMLTDDEHEAAAAALLAELAAAGGAGGCGDEGGRDLDGPGADADALAEAARWEPDPAEADPERGERAAASDIISLLVGIYGGKELFVAEYRATLGERLLAKGGYDCARELRTLELLKLRFGEAALRGAEVMLRDLADSKRVDANVHSVSDSATPLRRRRGLVDIAALSATVVSALFWPALPKEDFSPPPGVAAMLATYAHKYHSLKAPRVLEWRPALGAVDLELTLGGATLEFSVSPFLATVLLQFQARAEWPAAELAAAVGAPVDALRRRAAFWVAQGVVSEARGADGAPVYRRNAALQSGGAPGGGDAEAGMDLDGGGAGGAGSAAEAEAMARLETFVLGMLTNLDALPLERIHNFLKMFACDPPYDRSAEQLEAYLMTLVREDKLSLEGGLFRKRPA
jgi:anaphase-promoting complex subunit 2